MKSKRAIRCILLMIGSGALVSGLLLYLAFRDTTYVALAVSRVVPLGWLRNALQPFDASCMRYYLPDFLWAFSLSCGLHLIFLPRRYGSMGCTLTVFGCGLGYECLQWGGVISGTGDAADILLYLLAGLSVNIIYFVAKKG